MVLQEEKTMTRAVIFDMFETLITHYHSPLYFGTQMAIDAGILVEKFQALDCYLQCIVDCAEFEITTMAG